MPVPFSGEDFSEWLHGCIPAVLEEGTAGDQNQAAAICSNIWDDYHNSAINSMDYAYSIIDKSSKQYEEDDNYVYITGVASTPTPDRTRDIVEPLGAKFKTPMPFMLMHRDDQPIGEMTFAKPDKKGIPFKAQLPKIKESGLLKDRVDLAIHSLKYNLMRGVSIGFRALDLEWMDDGGIHFKEWEWLELSLVSIPANAEAVIDAVKSIDRVNRAALGIKPSTIDDYIKQKPGGTGNTGKAFRRPIQLIPAKR